MRKVLGTGIVLTFLVTLWLVGPALAIGLNVLFRPDYEMRDFATEYRARLRPNRVYWYDYKVYRMDCPEDSEQRVVVLHTTEFDEDAAAFLARTHPTCASFVEQESDLWLGLRGILVGRW